MAKMKITEVNGHLPENIKTIDSSSVRGGRSKQIAYLDGEFFVGDTADPVISSLMRMASRERISDEPRNKQEIYISSADYNESAMRREVLDQRHLDNNLIEHYSDIPCSHTWLSFNNREYVEADKVTAYEIDGFDEYSKDELSKEHLLDHAQDLLVELSHMDYKKFTMEFNYLNFISYMELINLTIKQGRK